MTIQTAAINTINTIINYAINASQSVDSAKGVAFSWVDLVNSKTDTEQIVNEVKYFGNIGQFSSNLAVLTGKVANCLIITLLNQSKRTV